jgi:hypothetical protein
MDGLMLGGLAGLAATLPMTAVIAGGRAAGWLYTPPPAQIAGTAAAKAGVRPEPAEPAFTVGWLAAHFGYGAACGALYAALRPLLPPADPVAGLGYGLAVWAVSYPGLMPGLGLYPPPPADRRSRTAVMLAAHAIFGLALAAADRQVARRAGTRAGGTGPAG